MSLYTIHFVTVIHTNTSCSSRINFVSYSGMTKSIGCICTTSHIGSEIDLCTLYVSQCLPLYNYIINMISVHNIKIRTINGGSELTMVAD